MQNLAEIKIFRNLKLESRDVTIFIVNGYGKTIQKSTQMLITFGTGAQTQYKLNFWIALIKTFRMKYNLLGFAEVQILPFLVMSLLRHFLTLGFYMSIFGRT